MAFANENKIQRFFESNEEKLLSVASLLSQLDLDFPSKKINSQYTQNSMCKLYLFRVIKGISNYEALVKYLIKHEEEAFQLGFYKYEDGTLNLPKKRTYNDYLQAVDRNELNQLAKRILVTATKNNVLLDLEIVKKVLSEKRKVHRKKKQQIVKLIKELVYPKIDLKIKKNGKFTTKDLLDVLVHVAFTKDFTNNGSEVFSIVSNKKKTPSGDLMLHHFSKFKSTDQLKEMFDCILDFIFDFCKRNYSDLQRRKLDIAYDVHDIPFYGKQMDYVCGGKNDRGTSTFFKFLTCSVVVAGKRFVLDVIPMHSFNRLEKLLDKSLARVKNKVRIDRVYLDRGFDRSKTITVLNNHNVNFIMPKVRSPTVKSWFDKSENCKARVIKDFQIKDAKANLVLVDDVYGIKRAFICNFDIAPCLAYRMYKWYSLRW